MNSLRLLALATCCSAFLASGAHASVLRTVLDLTRAFDSAVAENTLETKPDLNAAAGVLTAPGIFQHPLSQGEASLTYQVELPPVAQGEQLVFLSWLGLRRGAKLDDPERPFDGIGFSLVVNGERLFRRVLLDTDPDSVLTDLTQFAGQRVSLSLRTDCNGQSNWDWALWLRPVIALIAPGERPRPRGELVLFEVRAPSGPGDEHWVRARAGQQELAVWWMPHAQLHDGERHFAMLRFAAPNSSEPVEVVAGPDLEIRNVSRLSLLPEPSLKAIASQRGVLWPGEKTSLVAVIRNDGPSPVIPQDRLRVALEVTGPATLESPAEAALESLGPGQEATLKWDIRTREAARLGVRATLQAEQGTAGELEQSLAISPKPAAVPNTVAEQPRIVKKGNDLLLDTPALRLQIVGDGARYHYALVYAARQGAYQLLGAIAPLSRFVYQGADHPQEHLVVPHLVRRGSLWVELADTLADGRGAQWRALLRFQLSRSDPWVETRYVLSTTQTRNLLNFSGPTVLAGERSFGESKDSALFPGLEMLGPNEPSSSTRDLAPPLHLRYVPNIYKITIPLLAVSDGQTALGLMWDMNRAWSPGNRGLAARFASPNFAHGQSNHLMGVFVPTPPHWTRENEELAEQPYVLEPGTEVTLSSQILVAPGDAFRAVWYWDKRYGIPEPMPWPRTPEQEIALCRKGFLETVWDPETKKSRHCIGWGPANAPGFATLLLWDSFLSRDSEGARLARERALLIGHQTLKEQGAGGLWSQANCHIMRLEFPFYFGYLDEAFPSLRERSEGLLASQEADGSWRFHPGEGRESLGKAGDAVLGTCAGPAYNLWRYARLSGDPRFIAAGEKALHFMRRFRVPAGAQGWECPIYEPDILAAAYAILAYTEAYRTTGDPQWLADAEYWAETGIPFIYVWNFPDQPGMLHATIPVIGSTFYTHSWLGLPVQWCGLVYAYGLQHLADCGSPRADFWRSLAKGVTVSGAYQQFDADDPRAGTYPDSFNVWTGARNPAYINPEDIVVNLLALLGHDPDISSARAAGGPQGAVLHLSSGARVLGAVATPQRLRAILSFFQQETAYSLVAGGPEPLSVQWEGRALPKVDTLAEAEEGWTYADGFLFIRQHHRQPQGELVVTF